jgi:beta-N-acetylhexosaminidase
MQWLGGMLLLAFTVHGQEFVPPRSVDAVERIMAAMTLEQKVGQMFIVGLYGPNLTEDGQQFLARYQPGGVVVFNYNAGTPAKVTQLINDWQQVMSDVGAPALLVAIDQEGGRINTLEDAPFTQFPAPALVTAADNPAVAYQFGYALATELRAVGINMNLAPVADLETNPDNPVIFRRSYGSDPVQVGNTLAAVVEGMQAAGVIATLKHFPGHGDTAEDSHIELPILYSTQAELEAREWLPFQMGMQAGASTIMVGHLDMAMLDPDLPSSLSPHIVQGILREQMGYNGLIMTDALDMDAIDTRFGLSQAAVRAILAGNDLITPGPHVGTQTVAPAIEAVVAAVESGEIPMERIDASVRRILEVKLHYNLLEWQALDPSTADARIAAANAELLIQDLFSLGVTVVYDEAGILPLRADQRVLLVHPLHRLGASRACLAANPNLQLAGYSNYPTADEIQAAATAAQTADWVVVFTQNAIDKPEQAALVDALPPEKTVVVAYWSPYDVLAFAVRPAAYLTTYSPSDEGLMAACRVLFGAQGAYGVAPLALGQ